MTWLWFSPLIATFLAHRLNRSPWGHVCLSELPGLLFILAAGKPYRVQARRIMASRAQNAEPDRTLREVAARREQIAAQREAIEKVAPILSHFVVAAGQMVACLEADIERRAPRPSRYGALLCAERGHHIFTLGSKGCLSCKEDR